MKPVAEQMSSSSVAVEGSEIQSLDIREAHRNVKAAVSIDPTPLKTSGRTVRCLLCIMYMYFSS